MEKLTFTIRRFWRPALPVLVLACTQEITAPGTCPDYCSPVEIEVLDSLVVDRITRDSSYTGYVASYEAPQIQINGGGNPESEGVYRFLPFAEEIDLGVFPPETRPVVQTDSFRVEFRVAGRSADSGMVFSIHRLPGTTDTSDSHAALSPFFEDSTELATVAIADSVSETALSALLAGDAFPNLEAEGRVATVGVSFKSPSVGWADLQVGIAAITRYVKVDSAGGVLVELQESVGVDQDWFTFLPHPVPDPLDHFVGGSPAARSLLRFDLSEAIIDASNVIRATLVLIPTAPLFGALGDTVRLRAEGIAADFGSKSPIVSFPDSLDLSIGGVRVPTGSTDTLRIDITHITTAWRADTVLPRAVLLRTSPEGVSPAEFRLGSTLSGAPPQLRLTFVPPVVGGGQP